MNALKPNVVATPVVFAEDLTRRFGDLTAVDHIHVTVQSGELFGLLRANGAGKTTTIWMPGGMLPPTAGRIRVAAKRILGQRSRERNRTESLSV